MDNKKNSNKGNGIKNSTAFLKIYPKGQIGNLEARIIQKPQGSWGRYTLLIFLEIRKGGRKLQGGPRPSMS